MFLFHPIVPEGAPALDPVQIPTPSLAAGLFIKTRAGETIRAPIPYVYLNTSPVYHGC